MSILEKSEQNPTGDEPFTCSRFQVLYNDGYATCGKVWFFKVYFESTGLSQLSYWFTITLYTLTGVSFLKLNHACLPSPPPPNSLLLLPSLSCSTYHFSSNTLPSSLAHFHQHVNNVFPPSHMPSSTSPPSFPALPSLSPFLPSLLPSTHFPCPIPHHSLSSISFPLLSPCPPSTVCYTYSAVWPELQIGEKKLLHRQTSSCCSYSNACLSTRIRDWQFFL